LEDQAVALASAPEPLQMWQDASEDKRVLAAR